MKLLFDTHTFIWWDSQPNLLSTKVKNLCSVPENELILSVVSAWEMQIKSELGKLSLSLPLSDIIQQQLENNEINLLSVELEHILELNSLPNHHRDPFDRILIAQARILGATLLSHDSIFSKYPVDVIWT